MFAEEGMPRHLVASVGTLDISSCYNIVLAARCSMTRATKHCRSKGFIQPFIVLGLMGIFKVLDGPLEGILTVSPVEVLFLKNTSGTHPVPRGVFRLSFFAYRHMTHLAKSIIWLKPPLETLG